MRSLRGVEASRAGEESPGDAQLQAHHAALLERAQPIIEILRQASQVQRCDFAGVRPNEPVPSITPSWLPGMRELARLVRADAARLEESDDHDQAAARPDIPLCMSAHLAQGKSIAESVTAHAIMNEAATRVNALLDSGKLSDESRRALARAAAKLESRDALGFNAAVAADRESLARAITVDGRRGEMPEVESFRREKLDPLNADQIVYAIAVWERVQAIKAEEVKARTAALKQQAEAAQNQDQPQPPPQHALPGVQTTIELPDFDPANRLEDVIDRAVLEQVWQAAQHVIESVKRGEIPSGNDLPIILDAASRSRQAAADVQRLLKTVESEIAKVEKSKVESRKEGKRY